VEPEIAPSEPLTETVAELGADDLRERVHGEEEVRVSRGNPP
jgi:hypothetical protein